MANIHKILIGILAILTNEQSRQQSLFGIIRLAFLTLNNRLVILITEKNGRATTKNDSVERRTVKLLRGEWSQHTTPLRERLLKTIDFSTGDTLFGLLLVGLHEFLNIQITN